MEKTLELEFEELRKKLYSLVSTLGFHDKKVITLSQKLDQLHNQILKQNKIKKNS